MSKFRNFTFLMAAGLLLSACSNRPKGVLSDSKMEDLMVDLLLAEAYGQSSASDPLPDSVRNKLGEAVLVKHGVDRATLDATYDWYAANLDDYYQLYDKVNRRLGKMRAKTGASTFDDNSANLWQLPRHILFSPLAKSDMLVFEIPAEGLSKGDLLEWRLRFSSPVDATAFFGVDYNDDASTINDVRMQTDRVMTVTLQTDTAREVKRIFGSIRVKQGSMPVWADSVRIIKMPFDSLKFYNGLSHQKLSHGAKKRVVVKDTAINRSTNGGKDSLQKIHPSFATEEEIKESATMKQQKRALKNRTI